MSRKLLIFSLCLLAVSFTFIPLQKADAQARFGIKGGVNFADLKYEPKDQTEGVPDANSLTSFHIGLIADLPLVEGLALQPGVILSGKGSKLEYKGSFGKGSSTINPLYVEVPVNVLFKPQIGEGSHLYIGAGPYVGFGVGGKSTVSGEIPDLGFDLNKDHNLKYGNDSGDDLKSTDIGANVLVGFEFRNGFLIGAQYGMSFTNNAPKSDDNASKILKNKVLSISVGYLF